MTTTVRIAQLLGLARRAGGIAPGTDAVRQAIRGGEAHVVLFAGDASPVQLDKIARTTAGRSIPTVRFGNRESLGATVGHAPLAALAVTNASLAERLLAELGEMLPDDSVAVEG